MDTRITHPLLILTALFGATVAQAQTAPVAAPQERTHTGRTLVKPYGSGYEARGLGGGHGDQTPTHAVSVAAPLTASVPPPAEEVLPRSRSAHRSAGNGGAGNGSSGGGAGGGRR